VGHAHVRGTRRGQAAYAARHKASLVLYRFQITSATGFRTIRTGMMDGEPRKCPQSRNTYGIWEVGNPTAPALAVDGVRVLLSDVVGTAVFSGVARVYLGLAGRIGRVRQEP